MKNRLQGIRALIDAFRRAMRSSDQSNREWRARRLIPSVSAQGRARFQDEVLARLLDAGWHEGRRWDAGEASKFETCFARPYPKAIHDVLLEFGGLSIGFGGRCLRVGWISERLRGSRDVLQELVGVPLYPIGETNTFEDDGLGVHVDSQGWVYVDGATGFEPPRDYRIDLMASDMDRFLNDLFANSKQWLKEEWYYSEPFGMDHEES